VVELRLRGTLTEKAEASGWEIAKMEIMPDHVHLFLKAPPVEMLPRDGSIHSTAKAVGFLSQKHRKRDSLPLQQSPDALGS
jgi:REP element-mobilizing transposase RayT